MKRFTLGLSFKLDMHENTFFENKEATTTILLPKGSIKTLKIGKNFIIKARWFN